MKKKAKYSRIMLVDDSEIDNFINQKMIEGYGFAERIYIHTSSKSALEFLTSLKTTGPMMKDLLPEIIFLDINMPIMDGFQFLDEFHKMGEEVKSICKVVMLTSSVNPADIENSKKVTTVVSYINKPLTKEALASL
jgi:CheY-like chemotaxis protein